MLKLKSMRIFFTILFLIIPFLYSPAANIMKDDARAYREEGYRLQSMGDLQGALAYYQKTAYMDPLYPEVQNDLGVVYEALGDEDSALMAYKKVLELDPTYLAAYTNLAFLYEKKGDIKNATFYWKKRYEMGQEGDYWWEVSRQHLLKLGTYPEVRKALLEEKAARLSRDYVYKREQERLKLNEEAKLHFDIGEQAFKKGDQTAALKEFQTVLSLNPPDEKLISKTLKLFKESQRIYLREKAYSDVSQAAGSMEKSDYLSAEEKLKDAITTISRITQEQ
ncbi:MAG: tetratricopeptide repeat protein [Candidatus Omnitrophota bacterium]